MWKVWDGCTTCNDIIELFPSGHPATRSLDVYSQSVACKFLDLAFGPVKKRNKALCTDITVIQLFYSLSRPTGACKTMANVQFGQYCARMRTEFLWTANKINMLNNWSLQRSHKGLERQTSTVWNLVKASWSAIQYKGMDERYVSTTKYILLPYRR